MQTLVQQSCALDDAAQQHAQLLQFAALRVCGREGRRGGASVFECLARSGHICLCMDAGRGDVSGI
jgi:hypothetical protein